MTAFSLETLLRVKRWRLKRLQGDLDALRAAEIEWLACEKAIEGAYRKGDRIQLERWEAYRERLEPQFEAIEKKQDEVATAHREVKMLEKLKEKHYHRLLLRESKRETAFLDDTYRRHPTGR